MIIPESHSWDLTPREAVALQRELAAQTVTDRPLTSCSLIAGADVSYDRFSSTFFAGVVVLRTEDLTVVERRGVMGKCTFPYVPGLLSFREAPIVLDAFRLLDAAPDAVMCDGQGLAHPRRMGLACHLGLWLKTPCFGCAKTWLIGDYEEPDLLAGSTTPLVDGDTVLGSVVRTKTRVNPVYVSPGHLIDHGSAVHWALASCRGYRVPEPTRQAHLFVNELRRGDTTL
jgi:deoxyribonuclease V